MQKKQVVTAKLIMQGAGLQKSSLSIDVYIFWSIKWLQLHKSLFCQHSISQKIYNLKQYMINWSVNWFHVDQLINWLIVSSLRM